MKVLVDTSVWSLALRRQSQDLAAEEQKIVAELKDIISENRAVLIGPIRQEILSGIAQKSQFLLLKEKLNNFKDWIITTADYELAAELFNDCRQQGITGSHTDFLICAIAKNNSLAIFSTDQDFPRIREVIDFELT